MFHWLVLIHRTHLSAIHTVTFGLAMCPGEREERGFGWPPYKLTIPHRIKSKVLMRPKLQTFFSLPPADLDSASLASFWSLNLSSLFSPLGLCNCSLFCLESFSSHFHLFGPFTSLSSQPKVYLLRETISSHHFCTVHIFYHFSSPSNPLLCFIFIHRNYNLFTAYLWPVSTHNSYLLWRHYLFCSLLYPWLPRKLSE